MLQHVPLLIGLRYIRAKRRNQFISFVSGFSLLGMCLGVTALVIVMSVMNGFGREIKQGVLKAVPHGFVEHDGGIANWQSVAAQVEQYPDVVATAPYIESAATLSFQNSVIAVQVQGILPERESRVSVINDYMRQGQLSDLAAGDYGIVLGGYIADYLGASLGDKVKLTTPEPSITLLGPQLRERFFTVVGRFNVGLLDQSLALINIRDAQVLFRQRGRVQGLHVKVSDIYRANTILNAVKARLGDDYQVKDWTQTQSDLFQAVKMEKIVVFVMLSIIVAIAAFNIVSSLVLMVADKRADIAVLRTLGLTGRQIMAVFVIQGSAVGCIGLTIGLVIGGIGAVYTADIVGMVEKLFGAKVFDPTVYYVSSIPSQWQWSDSLIIGVIAVVLSVTASLYPAYRAGRIPPAEALRYE